jgi:hypothetical protein
VTIFPLTTSLPSTKIGSSEGERAVLSPSDYLPYPHLSPLDKISVRQKVKGLSSRPVTIFPIPTFLLDKKSVREKVKGRRGLVRDDFFSDRKNVRGWVGEKKIVTRREDSIACALSARL